MYVVLIFSREGESELQEMNSLIKNLDEETRENSFARGIFMEELSEILASADHRPPLEIIVF